MSSINSTIAGLELAQISWVVPDIHAAMEQYSINTCLHRWSKIFKGALDIHRRLESHRTNAERSVRENIAK